MPQGVEFIGEVGKWVCVKKIKVDEKTPMIEVARNLASINDTIERKTWDFIKDDFDIENLNQIAYEIAGAEKNKKDEWEVKGKVSEEKISECLAKINNPGTTKKMTEKNVKTAAAKEISKSYLTFKVMDLLKVRLKLDPTSIDQYQQQMKKLELGI